MTAGQLRVGDRVDASVEGLRLAATVTDILDTLGTVRVVLEWTAGGVTGCGVARVHREAPVPVFEFGGACQVGTTRKRGRFRRG